MVINVWEKLVILQENGEIFIEDGKSKKKAMGEGKVRSIQVDNTAL